MNDKLAKELKDAGFAQMQTIVDFDENKTIEGGHGISALYDEEIVYMPTLSELIEACGEPFYLETCPNWIAGRTRDTDEITGGIASTPEEAVAKLWLELNKK